MLLVANGFKNTGNVVQVIGRHACLKQVGVNDSHPLFIGFEAVFVRESGCHLKALEFKRHLGFRSASTARHGACDQEHSNGAQSAHAGCHVEVLKSLHIRLR